MIMTEIATEQYTSKETLKTNLLNTTNINISKMYVNNKKRKWK